ncbi:unnamed protein product [Dibothriocephalus latus]|uniref:receptor protein serine/threonine kinase n=1 Tax=Dibothriocephalus latus TaxID=60516 RepID=A0A3P7M3C7_DIBLA|nr:unnamed protein product [Dibothriocephalus latus]
MQKAGGSLTCFCSPADHCAEGRSQCSSDLGCFYSALRTPGKNTVYNEQFGCLSNDTSLGKMLCTAPIPENMIVKCCFSPNQAFCNAHLRLHDKALYPWRGGISSYCISILLPVVAVGLTIVVFGLLVHFLLRPIRHRGDFSKPPRTPSGNSITDKRLCGTIFPADGDFQVLGAYPQQTFDGTLSADSGSGGGVPFLVRQTIARRTLLTDCIGKGRFGEVWQADCQGEKVAVKIFSSRDGASWARETEIYSTSMLRHPNLLAYYASDMISRGGCTQLWLITAYHRKGSLHDYLRVNKVSLAGGLRFARSAAAGLAFLHTASLLFKRYASAGPPSAGPLAGTKRYMAPELLYLALLLTTFHTSKGLDYEEREEGLEISEVTECQHPFLPLRIYQAADIYALGLVLWEIFRRTEGLSVATSNVEEYQIPYEDAVPVDPTFSQMFQVVVLGNLPFEAIQLDQVIPLPLSLTTCTSCRGLQDRFIDLKGSKPTFCWSGTTGIRPVISRRWLEAGSGMQRLSTLLQECWVPIWSNRLSALRVRKTLESLEAELRS